MTWRPPRPAAPRGHIRVWYPRIEHFDVACDQCEVRYDYTCEEPADRVVSFEYIAVGA